MFHGRRGDGLELATHGWRVAGSTKGVLQPNRHSFGELVDLAAALVVIQLVQTAQAQTSGIRVKITVEMTGCLM